MSEDDIDPPAPAETPDVAVGYGKPPKAKQFKPGKSGNSKGRPPGAKGRRGIIERVLTEKQKVKECGIEKTYTTLDLVVKQVLNLSCAGNARAFKAMDKLQVQFAPKEARWIGGLLMVPEPLTEEEWDERYSPKDQSSAQKPPDET